MKLLGFDVIKHEYRGPCLTLCCDVIDDVINTLENISYYIWHVVSEYAIRFELCWKLTKIEIAISHFRFSTSGDLLDRKRYRKLMISQRWALVSTTLWFFKFCCSWKIKGVTSISNFDLCGDLVTLTFDLWPWKENSDGAATKIHLWTNFGKDVSKGSRVIRNLIKRRTNRQTNR